MLKQVQHDILEIESVQYLGVTLNLPLSVPYAKASATACRQARFRVYQNYQQERNHPSEHRIHVSEHRINISEERISISALRTDISEVRINVSEVRTSISEVRNNPSA